MSEVKLEPIEGVCTCGGDTWKWKLEEGQIILTCTVCGKQAHFGVPFPMLDMIADSKL